MRLLYTIFGDQLIYYHLSAFLFRSLGGLAFYWTLNRVWQENKPANFLMALFFLVYPGFLMQVQPFDYQSHILSICLAMISIALTVWAVTAKSTLWKTASALAAILTGWGYLALIEFHIGLEFLRLLFVVILFLQENNESGRRRIFTPVLRWLPFSIIPLGYLFWRTVFFHNTRAATDVGVQLGVFFQAPFRVGAQWLVDTLYGVFNTLLSAWVVPFYENVILGGFHPSENLLILAAGILGLALLYLGLFVFGDLSGERISASGWARQALWTGLAATFAGVLPVIVTNRTVDFFSSRYTMASVPGAVMLIVAGISLLRLPRVRSGLVGLLVFISVAVHTGNALNHVHQADSLRDFWWQVSWRAPSIEKGTNLVAVYSSMQTPANYDIWGPANLIYFPEKQVEIPIKIQLPASVLSRDNVTGIIAGGEGRDKDQRGNFVSEDFSAVLLITQPAPENCVRIIDGELPELSSADKYEIMLLAPYSLIGNVNLADTAPVLPRDIFGPEPAHGWCYYYEKAALASQMGDWDLAILLGEAGRGEGAPAL